MPTRGINGIGHGQRRISADTTLRLARYFGTSERVWMNLQLRYDIEIEKGRARTELDEITAVPQADATWAIPDRNRRPLDPQDGRSEVIAAQSLFYV